MYIRCVEVFAQDGERFERWMESDANAAKAKLAEAAAAPGAWRAVDWKVGGGIPLFFKVLLGFDERTRRRRGTADTSI